MMVTKQHQAPHRAWSVSPEESERQFQSLLAIYDDIIFIDTEFNGGIGAEPVTDFELDGKGKPINKGHRPNPVSLAAYSLRTGKWWDLWQTELGEKPPFDTSYRTLFVSFMASAEFEFFIAAGWPLPEAMIDLHAEYRNIKNGLLTKSARYGLLDVARKYTHVTVTKEEKTDWRLVILRGGWTEEQIPGIRAYNRTDVEIMVPLFRAMLPEILSAVPGKTAQENFEYALMRGQYMGALAWWQWYGIPWDVPLFNRFTTH